MPYDCRHTFVCLMLMGGAQLGYVSTQIGHRTVATTLRHYFRWVQNDEGDQVQADILEPKSGTREGSVSAKYWSRRRDLNPRPADYESAALPLSYTGFSQRPRYFAATVKGTTAPRVVNSVGEFRAIRSIASALWLGERCAYRSTISSFLPAAELLDRPQVDAGHGQAARERMP